MVGPVCETTDAFLKKSSCGKSGRRRLFGLFGCWGIRTGIVLRVQHKAFGSRELWSISNVMKLSELDPLMKKYLTRKLYQLGNEIHYPVLIITTKRIFGTGIAVTTYLSQNLLMQMVQSLKYILKKQNREVVGKNN